MSTQRTRSRVHVRSFAFASATWTAATAIVLFGASSCGSFSHSFVNIQPSNLPASAQRDETLALDLAAGRTLHLSTPAGHIEVNVAAADAAPSLTAHFDAPGHTDEEARLVLDRYRLVRDDQGGATTFRIEGSPLLLTEGMLTTSLAARVDFVATVPNGVHVELDTRSGDIRCEGALASARLQSSYGALHAKGVEGPLHAKTSSGNIGAEDIRGDVELSTSYGRIDAQRTKGAQFSAASSSGSLRLAEIDAPLVQAKTSYGSVELDRINGKVTATSSSGNVSATHLSGGDASLRSGYGKVSVDGASGALELKSSSGSVRCDNVSGSVEAESGYGNVDVAGVLDSVRAKSSSGAVSVRANAGSQPRDGWDVRSGYGKVTLSLPASLAFDLDAQTSYGSVESDFAVLVEAGHKAKSGQLRGKVGGGGVTMQLRSSSGNVELRKSDG